MSFDGSGTALYSIDSVWRDAARQTWLVANGPRVASEPSIEVLQSDGQDEAEGFADVRTEVADPLGAPTTPMSQAPLLRADGHPLDEEDAHGAPGLDELEQTELRAPPGLDDDGPTEALHTSHIFSQGGFSQAGFTEALAAPSGLTEAQPTEILFTSERGPLPSELEEQARAFEGDVAVATVRPAMVPEPVELPDCPSV